MEKIAVVRKVPVEFSKWLVGFDAAQTTTFFAYCWDLWIKKMCLDTWGEAAGWDTSCAEIQNFLIQKNLHVPIETIEQLFHWSFQYFLNETAIELIDFVGIYKLSDDMIAVVTDLTSG